MSSSYQEAQVTTQPALPSLPGRTVMPLGLQSGPGARSHYCWGCFSHCLPCWGRRARGCGATHQLQTQGSCLRYWAAQLASRGGWCTAS